MTPPCSTTLRCDNTRLAWFFMLISVQDDDRSVVKSEIVRTLRRSCRPSNANSPLDSGCLPTRAGNPRTVCREAHWVRESLAGGPFGRTYQPSKQEAYRVCPYNLRQPDGYPGTTTSSVSRLQKRRRVMVVVPDVQLEAPQRPPRPHLYRM